jgi:hypothetical protein
VHHLLERLKSAAYSIAAGSQQLLLTLWPWMTLAEGLLLLLKIAVQWPPVWAALRR